jgi:acetoin utilization deacetylase AcuC-like enzyme
MTRRGALITHPDCIRHEMQTGHPERPARLTAVLDHLAATGLAAELDHIAATPTALAELESIHDSGYLRALYAAAPRHGLIAVDPDTAMGPFSLTAAELAAGAVRDAVALVMTTAMRRVFCAVRPPGHHAEEDQAMGFCFFNNVALGARTALSEHGLERVAILDFDVHHGNGTVDIFRDTPEVLVCSSFQHPHYPHRLFDLQRPNIVNTPLPAGTNGHRFRVAVERDWLPALAKHRPQLIIVSAGFDAHTEDPLGGLHLVEDDFTWVTELIVAEANTYAQGRIVSVLEGGYALGALARSASAHVAALLEN